MRHTILAMASGVLAVTAPAMPQDNSMEERLRELAEMASVEKPEDVGISRVPDPQVLMTTTNSSPSVERRFSDLMSESVAIDNDGSLTDTQKKDAWWELYKALRNNGHIDQANFERAVALGVDPVPYFYHHHLNPPGVHKAAKDALARSPYKLWDREAWTELPELRASVEQIDEARVVEWVNAHVEVGFTGYVCSDFEMGFMWPCLSSFEPDEEPYQTAIRQWNRWASIIKRERPGVKIAHYGLPYMGRLLYRAEHRGFKAEWAALKLRQIAGQLDGTLVVDYWAPSHYDHAPGGAGDGPGDPSYEEQHSNIAGTGMALGDPAALIARLEAHYGEDLGVEAWTAVTQPWFGKIHNRARRPSVRFDDYEFWRDQVEPCLNWGAAGVFLWKPRQYGTNWYTPPEAFKARWPSANRTWGSPGNMVRIAWADMITGHDLYCLIKWVEFGSPPSPPGLLPPQPDPECERDLAACESTLAAVRLELEECRDQQPPPEKCDPDDWQMGDRVANWWVAWKSAASIVMRIAEDGTTEPSPCSPDAWGVDTIVGSWKVVKADKRSRILEPTAPTTPPTTPTSALGGDG